MGENAFAAEAVLSGFPDAVLVLDRGKVIWANAKAVQLWRRDPLIGLTLAELLGASEHERFSRLRQQKEEGWPLPEACRAHALDGRPPLELRMSVLEGALEILTARDATDAARAEGLIGRLAEASIRALMADENALLDAVEPAFRELSWVAAFTRVLPQGSRVERVLARDDDPVGRYGRSLVGKEQPRSETPVLQQVVTTGQPLFLDNLPTVSSPPLPAERLSASMIDARVARSAWYPIFTPELTHVLSVTGPGLTEHDFAAIGLFAAKIGANIRLTGMRRELVRRERLAAIGETATVLAHELRNPLGVVFNVVSALRADPQQTEHRKGLVRLLDEEAGRLQRLVGDLLDFAREAPPRFEEVQLAELIESSIEAAETEPAWQATEPAVAISAAAGIAVRTDPHLLRRALLNVLVNAAQHSRPGGIVRVTVRPGPDALAIDVWNEGAPMAPEVAARAFEPFFTTREGGTGLGLAITRRLCDELGGRVEVGSSADGVSFVITLPRAAAEVTRP